MHISRNDPHSFRFALSMWKTGIDLSVFSTASMFTAIPTALDIFGDKETSDVRRRCQPDEGEGTSLLDLHLTISGFYVYAYAGVRTMPYCLDVFEPLMEQAGLPLSLVLDVDADVSTPWGLAKAYVDEVFGYLDENDGWNADGSMSRDYNRVPFSDFTITDSAGNSWAPYKPRNTPYKVELVLIGLRREFALRSTSVGFVRFYCQRRSGALNSC